MTESTDVPAQPQEPASQNAASEMEARFAQFVRASPRIILGSSSSSRRQIMTELLQPYQVTYDVRTADIDEMAIRRPEPRDLVVALAHAKADAIKAKMRAAGEPLTGYLLTCDQVVVHEGRILEKPESHDEARQFINGYSRAPASTVGSVLCTNLDTNAAHGDVDVSTIHFSAIPQNTIDKLILEGDCFYCAGGLMVEHPLVSPHVTRLEGTQDAVMGLSKELVKRLLLQAAGLM